MLGVAAAALAALIPAGPAPAAMAGHHAPQTAAGTLSTAAGGPGGPGPATKIAIGPTGVAYGHGDLYIADGYVQELGSGGRLTTPVGASDAGNAALNDGGLATDAGLGAGAVAVAPSGNLVIADSLNNRVRVAAARTGTFYHVTMTAGHIYTITGTFWAGFNGNGIPATTAELHCPSVALDHAGNAIIADSCNQQIRVVANRGGTFYGQRMKAGFIYQLAGNGDSGFSGDGGPAVSAELSYPDAVSVDSAGNVLIADTFNNRIRVVAETTGTFYGQPMTAGDIYTIAGNGSTTPVPGGPATQSGIDRASGVTVDKAGNVLLTADLRPGAGVFVVANSDGTFYGQPMTAGDIYQVHAFPVLRRGGGSQPGRWFSPSSVTLDGSGNLVFADGSYVAAYAVSSGRFYGQPMAAGNTYAVAGVSSSYFSGDGGPATAAVIHYPEDVAADGAGNEIVADTLNSRIRVVAASTGTFYGRAMTAGDIYELAGDGKFAFAGDGGPAANAALKEPWGVAVDHDGNVVIADTLNHRIRVVAASTGTFYGQAMTAGSIYTVAGGGSRPGNGIPAVGSRLKYPQTVAVDSVGNLVIDDRTACRIYVVATSSGTFYGQAMTAGDRYTVAGNGTCNYSGDGGVATREPLYEPEGAAVDAAGNILIADTWSNRVRVVAAAAGTFYGQAMKAGHIYTVAGNGTGGYSGDGGPATAAELNGPEDMAVDSSGNVVISDTIGNRVRVVAATAATFYGVAMTAGDIYTIAGNGTAGSTGEGGPAVSAEIDQPDGIAMDGPNVVFAEPIAFRVMTVSG